MKPSHRDRDSDGVVTEHGDRASTIDEAARAESTIDEAARAESAMVEEVTTLLPTSELIKLIKKALECGKRNVPFTESELVSAMALGLDATQERRPLSQRARGTRR